LLPLVLDSWNYGLITGSLAPSHSRSCITIIPKVGKDNRLIKNWRPITVSACDIKIITKCLALRVAKYLDSILSGSQAAYVPGRDINFNNRLLSFILNDDENNSLFSILSFDAEKAFDSLDHEYIRNTLVQYGFPDSFISAFNLLYSNLDAVLQINGWLSSPFAISRGVKQGCALSCCLFVLCIDPLLQNIEANSNILGYNLSLPGEEPHAIKVLAYADDVAAIVQNDNSINQIFYEYERLYLHSGLKLNGSKTECLPLSANAAPIGAFSYINEQINLNIVAKIKVCGNVLALDPLIRYNEILKQS